MFCEISGNCFQGYNHHRYYCCFFSYCTVFLLRLSDLGTKRSFLFFSDRFCYLLVLPHQSNTPGFLLWARYFSVWILKFQIILTSSFWSTFSTLCSHHFSDATLLWSLYKSVCAILPHELIKLLTESSFFLHNDTG